MKHIKLKILFTLLLFNSFIGFSNEDSLLVVWEDNSLHDTSRTNAFQTYIVNYFLYNNPDSAFHLAEDYYYFSKKRGLKSKMSTALNIQGISKYFIGDYDEAITYYSRSLKYRQKVGDEAGMASVLNNIGNVYLDKADYVKALKYFFKSLKLEEKLGNEDGIAGSLNNIGLIYKEQGEYEEALSYYFRSLKLKVRTGDRQGESNTLSNIGVVYLNQKNYEEALNYFEKSLEISNGEDRSTALIKFNIGDIFLDQMDYDNAVANFKEALKMYENLGDVKGESAALNKLGSVYFSKNNLLKAIYNSKKALLLATDIEGRNEIMNAAKNLHLFYNSLEKSKEALEMYSLYIDTKNEINNEMTNKELMRQAFAYEYDKKVTKDSLENLLVVELSEAKLFNERKKKELAEQKNYFLYGGLLLALLLGGFVYSKFKVISKQKIIIEEQKLTVDNAFIALESKNKEVLDSIQYAKRIQLAILPSDKVIKNHFQSSFILYKPKDIVAGDFYWMEDKDDKVLFAVADCTGHGVPGAMVSVVCNNGLNRSVREYGLDDPAKILDKTREIVTSEFEKSDKDVSDGMDIAFCSYENGILKYAGANNPLWIIRDNELLEYKADKQPIGKYPKNVPFTTHTIEVVKGDVIYLATDGYADQFGGDSNKKLKTKEFKKLLLRIHTYEMAYQKEMLDDSFMKWKGDFEQLDDVCVLGVKVS